MADTSFSTLSDDIILKIFFHLEDDPRNWARLSCVCRKFSSLISTVCSKAKCISLLSPDLLSLSSPSPSLLKLAVCCPGLVHAGVLLDNSDFGLHRELHHSPPDPNPDPVHSARSQDDGQGQGVGEGDLFGGWSLYDDLYFDTVYDNSETSTPMEITTGVAKLDSNKFEVNESCNKRRRKKSPSRFQRSHLASGVWNLSREQGNKLLASRFRGDCLYICDWPGCVHMEEKRNYMLFRGVFKNFKRSRVWRTINDANRTSIDLNCAFCSCEKTWDLLSAFCLKRGFGFHDDGEPVVRAYVCENGHVSGAWTDLPLYT